MSVAPARVTVTTVATRLDVTAEADYAAGAPAFVRTYGQAMVVRNRDTSNSVYLGGPTVTAATGFELAAGESMSLDLANNDALYGITASGTVPCHVLQTGV